MLSSASFIQGLADIAWTFKRLKTYMFVYVNLKNIELGKDEQTELYPDD